MPNVDNFDKLKTQLSKLQLLNETDFALAQPYLKTKKIFKKEHFLSINQKTTHIGYIIKGIFRLYYFNDKGDEITTCFCRENNFITSMNSFITQKNSDIAFQALEPSELLVISFDDLKLLYSQSNNWMALANHLTQMEFYNFYCYSKFLTQKDASEKYKELIKTQPELINRVPLQYLASYLGISKETLSRIRRKKDF